MIDILSLQSAAAVVDFVLAASFVPILAVLTAYAILVSPLGTWMCNKLDPPTEAIGYVREPPT